MKTSILLSLFGVSTIEAYREQIELAVEVLEKRLKHKVFLGFTSEFLIKKINNSNIVSLEKRLDYLKELGYEKVIVVKLMLSSGKENQKINDILEKNKNRFKEIIVTEPILAYKEKFIESCVDIEKETILISHGREDGEVDIVEKNFNKLIDAEYSKLRCVNLNNKEACESIISYYKELGCNTLVLKPILITKGYHFEKDIFSDREDSFRSILKKAGFNLLEKNNGLITEKSFIEFLISYVSLL